MHPKKSSIFSIILLCCSAFLSATPLFVPSSQIYRISQEGNLEHKQENQWIVRNEGLPLQTRYPFEEENHQSVISFGISPSDSRIVAVTTSNQIFLSMDSGEHWENIETSSPLKNSDYYTSIAVNPLDENNIIVGTSFHAFFMTKDRGNSWTDISQHVTFIYHGTGFYNTITGISFDPLDTNYIYFAAGYQGDLYHYNILDETWSKIDLPEGFQDSRINRIQTVRNESQQNLELYTEITLLNRVLPEGEWSSSDYTPSTFIPLTQEEARRHIQASNKTGLYINPHRASGTYLEEKLALIEANGMNSLVVDCKDDEGNITYNSTLDFPEQINAIKTYFNLEELISKAHEKEIYVIARIVVFKDRSLYGFNNNQYALWNTQTNRPWGQFRQIEDSQNQEVSWEQIDHWVDPFSEFVWDYNIAIAKELQDRGVDEIQFDYIRCPSDGPVNQIRYRFAKENMTRIDALCSFLIKARASIDIPIGTDVFGFNAWAPMEYLGQDITELARYVDVISPMLYPSHFNFSFLNNYSFFDRAEELYRQGSNRASLITGEQTIIRPYVQAFLIGNERYFESEDFFNYLDRQLIGVEKSLASGFTLWNASNNYYMLR